MQRHVSVYFGPLPRDFLPTVVSPRTLFGWRDGLSKNAFMITPGKGSTLTIYAPRDFLASLHGDTFSGRVSRLNALQEGGCTITILSPTGKPLFKSQVPEGLKQFAPDPPLRRISKRLLTVGCPSAVRKVVIAGLHQIHPGGNHL